MIAVLQFLFQFSTASAGVAGSELRDGAGGAVFADPQVRPVDDNRTSRVATLSLPLTTSVYV